MITCTNCEKELSDMVDTTYSNTGATCGQLTGEIYYCDECEVHVVDDHLNDIVRVWNY